MASSVRRYRRSAFNGSKQLSAAQAPNRRILILLGLLAFALIATLAVIVGLHLQSTTEPASSSPAPITHPASH